MRNLFADATKKLGYVIVCGEIVTRLSHARELPLAVLASLLAGYLAPQFLSKRAADWTLRNTITGLTVIVGATLILVGWTEKPIIFVLISLVPYTALFVFWLCLLDKGNNDDGRRDTPKSRVKSRPLALKMGNVMARTQYASLARTSDGWWHCLRIRTTNHRRSSRPTCTRQQLSPRWQRRAGGFSRWIGAGMKRFSQVTEILVLERETETPFVTWDERSRPKGAWDTMQDHPEHVLHHVERDAPRFLIPGEVSSIAAAIETLWDAGVGRSDLCLEIHPGGILRNPHFRAPNFCAAAHCVPIPSEKFALDALKVLTDNLKKSPG